MDVCKACGCRWAQHPASDCLNAEIARRVCGWRNVRPALSWPGHYVGDAPDTIISQDLPAYSSDIAAAWQIVQRMRALHWDVVLCNGYTTERAWYAAFVSNGPEFREGALSLPLAVCRAALAALDATQPA